MVKQSKHLKEWRQRWFVLTSQYLCSFKAEGDYTNPTEYVRLAECSTVKSAEDSTGKENSFCVQTAQRSFCLIARNAAEKEHSASVLGPAHQTSCLSDPVSLSPVDNRPRPVTCVCVCASGMARMSPDGGLLQGFGQNMATCFSISAGNHGNIKNEIPCSVGNLSAFTQDAQFQGRLRIDPPTTQTHSHAFAHTIFYILQILKFGTDF